MSAVMRTGNMFRRSYQLLKCAALHWVADNASTVGAALAFYCAFSLAPLLVIIVTLIGWIIGPDAASNYITAQLSGLFGPASARTIVTAMRSAQQVSGIAAAIISVFTLILSATTIFTALQTALNAIWGTTAATLSGVFGWIRSRILSLGFVLAIGFLLLMSMTISTALVAFQHYLADRFTALVVFAHAL